MEFFRLGDQFSQWAPALFQALVDATIRGVVILMLTAAVVLAMRRASAAARHLAWFLGVLGLLILPVLSPIVPAWHILPNLDVAPSPVAVARTPLSTPDVSPIEVPAPPVAPVSREIPSPDSSSSKSSSQAIPQTPPAPLPAASLSLPIQPTQPTFGLTWQTCVLLDWLTGSSLYFGYLILGWMSLRNLEHQSSRIHSNVWTKLLQEACKQLDFNKPVVLLGSSRRTMPMTWGLWTTRILLPDDAIGWTDEQRRAVLLHELAHAKRRDCLTQLLAQFACGLHWFNPLVWVAWRRMQAEREQACDDLVLSTGTKASAYAEQLLRIASEMPATRYSVAAIAMARPHTLEGRLRAILDTTRDRSRLAFRTLLMVCILVGIFYGTLAMLRAAVQSPSFRMVGEWAGAHGWKAQIATQTRLNWDGTLPPKSVKLSISKEEEADYEACHMTWSSDTSDHGWTHTEFADDSNRKVLEDVLKRRPHYFYAEFMLSRLFHRRGYVGDEQKAQSLLDASYQDAPVILVRRFELPDGSPMAGMDIPEYSVECARQVNGQLDFGLDLTFPKLQTDAQGCIYLPVYNSVYTQGGYALPHGFRLAEGNSQSRARFETVEKVAMLPAVTVVQAEFVPGPVQPGIISTAVLPGENMVELLAIGPFPNEGETPTAQGKAWWLPDGSPSPRAYRDQPGSIEFPAPQINGRQFVFRFANPIPSDSLPVFQFSEPIPGTTGFERPDAKDGESNLHAYFPTNPSKVSVRMGQAMGPWKPIVEYELKSSQSTGARSDEYQFVNPMTESSGLTRITLEHPTDRRDVDLRVVAVDTDRVDHVFTQIPGLIHGERSWNYKKTADGAFQQVTRDVYRFKDLPLTRITSFHLEYRDYQWVEFRNIAMNPTQPLSSAPTVMGRVVTTQGFPIGQAEISCVKPAWSATTDADGWFQLPDFADKGVMNADLIVHAKGFADRENVDLWSLKNMETNRGIIQMHRGLRLSGRVLGLDGKPLAGAPLSMDENYRYQRGSYSVSNAFTVTTDAQGRFEIDNVQPGDLRLHYPAEGRMAPVKGIKMTMVLHLTEGQDRNDLLFDMSKYVGSAEGRVVDIEGKPLSNAKVGLWLGPLNLEGLNTRGDLVTTDDQGRYRLEKLPLGERQLAGILGETKSPPVMVTLSNKTAQTPDIVLPVVQTAKGRIRRILPMTPTETVREWIDATKAGDADSVDLLVVKGSPFELNSARLSPLLEKIEDISFNQWSSNGTATVNLNLVGQKSVLTMSLVEEDHGRSFLDHDSAHWRIVDIADEAGKSLVNDAVTTPTAKVIGHIVDTQGKPIAHAELRSVKPDWSATTDSDGSFQFPDLDLAYVTVRAKGYVTREDLDLLVIKELLPTRDIQMHHVVRLSGTVLGHDGKPLAGSLDSNGKPLAGIPISAQTAYQYPDGGGTTWTLLSAITDAKGHFVIDDAQPGDMLLYYPWDEDDQTHAKQIKAGPNPVQTHPALKGFTSAMKLHVVEGQDQDNLVLDLSKSVASVEGRVVDQEGKPLPGASVQLWWVTSIKNLGGSIQSLGRGASLQGGPVKTDAQGRYRLANMPIGEWHVGAILDEFYPRQLESQPAPVTLSEKTAHAPDLVMPVTQNAKGQIRRVFPLAPRETVLEWERAVKNGDEEQVALLVAKNSPFARNSDRFLHLLEGIDLILDAEEYSPDGHGKVTMNGLDPQNRLTSKFIFYLVEEPGPRIKGLTYQGTRAVLGTGHWRITDVTDAAGVSLVADLATPKPSDPPTTQPAATSQPTPAAAKTPTRPMPFLVIDSITHKPLAGVELSIDGEVNNEDFTGTAKTDDTGKANVAVPQAQVKYLDIDLSKPGYVPMIARWPIPRSATQKLPDSYTFPLQPGSTIGGRVQDDSGKPVDGATVILSFRAKTDSPNQLIDNSDLQVKTGPDGKWEYKTAPMQIDKIRLGYYHPLYDNGQGQGYYNIVDAPPTSVRDGTSVLILNRGVPIQGTVFGPNGLPLPNALIAMGRDRVCTNLVPGVRSDPNGRFTVAGSPGEDVTMTVRADGYAPELQTFRIANEARSVELHLQPAKTIRGRILDPKGNPIPGVSLYIQGWRNCSTLETYRETDAEGRFVWDQAPADAVLADILKPGFGDIRNHSLIADGKEALIVMHDPTLVTCTVIDAETQKPIPSFRVVQGCLWPDRDETTPEKTTWIPNLDAPLIGHDGQYQFEADASYPHQKVRILVDGYAPADSRQFTPDEGKVELVFKLVKAHWLSGVVRNADGKPAPGVEVTMITPSKALYFIVNGRNQFGHPDDRTTKTQADGSYHFPPQTDPFTILVLNDQGFAECPYDQLLKSPDIKLQPWARIEGRMVIGNKPAVRQGVRGTAGNSQLQATTDDQGRFVIERVQPGKLRISRVVELPNKGSLETNTFSAQVAPGDKLHITIGGTGRPLVGQLDIPDRLKSHRYTLSTSQLLLKLDFPKPPTPAGFDQWPPAKRQEWGDAFAKTTEGSKFMAECDRLEEQEISYPVIIDSNGSYRIDDVPAGQYTLQISVRDQEQISALGRAIGGASMDVVVPEVPGGRSDDPMQLPVLAVKPTILRTSPTTLPSQPDAP